MQCDLDETSWQEEEETERLPERLRGYLVEQRKSRRAGEIEGRWNSGRGVLRSSMMNVLCRIYWCSMWRYSMRGAGRTLITVGGGRRFSCKAGGREDRGCLPNSCLGGRWACRRSILDAKLQNNKVTM